MLKKGVSFTGTVIGKSVKLPLPFLPYFQLKFSHISPVPFKLVEISNDKIILNFKIWKKEEISFKNILEIHEIAPFDQKHKLHLVLGRFFYPMINRNGPKGFGCMYEKGYIIKYKCKDKKIRYATFIVHDFKKCKKILEKHFPNIKKKEVDPFRPLIYEAEGKKVVFYGIPKLILFFIGLFLLHLKFSPSSLLGEGIVGTLAILGYIPFFLIYLSNIHKLNT